MMSKNGRRIREELYKRTMNCTYQKIKGTMNWNLKRGLFSSLNFGNDRCSEGLYQTQGMLWPLFCAIVVRLLNKSNSMHTINLF